MRVSVLPLLILTLAATPIAAQTPATSFAGLQPLVKVGQTLNVSDDQGRVTRGKLVSISGGQLRIRRPRFFLGTEARTFSERSVTRIGLKDSSWNGALLGAVAGVGLSFSLLHNCDDRCLLLATAAPFIVIGGAGTGIAIDDSHTRVVYENSGQAGRFTVTPLIQPKRVGILARVGF